MSIVFCGATGCDCDYAPKVEVGGVTKSPRAKVRISDSEDPKQWKQYWESKGLTYSPQTKTLHFGMKYLVVVGARSGQVVEKDWTPDRTGFYWSKYIYCKHALNHGVQRTRGEQK